MVQITPRDEAQIAFYFRAQDRFERSTSGPMLDRADRLGVDSSGRRIDAARDNWHWCPPARGEHGLDRYGSDHQLQVHETREGGGYEVEHGDLVAFASASRRMLAVERASPRAKVSLEAYYGPRGDGWAVRATGYEAIDPETKKLTSTPALGPGRVAALYMLTQVGAVFIAGERLGEKKSKRAIAAADKRAELELERVQIDATLDEALRLRASGERVEALKDRLEGLESDLAALEPAVALPRASLGSHLTDDEILKSAFAVQAAQPDAVRRARLQKVRDAAEELLRGAWGVWLKTAPERRARRAA